MQLKRSAIWFASVFITFSLLSSGCRTTEPADAGTTYPEPAEEPAEPDSTVDEATVPLDETIHPESEFRGVWVATVANIDWPSEPGLPVEKQKQEMIDILNRAAALNFNAVILQVRPAADAIYNSPHEPWSYYLTGKMGQAPLPAYDPLEFAVTEAHKRGLELHAWFNPYRALHPTNRSGISPDHISKTHPDYVHQYGDFLWMDPGLPEVKEHTIRVIMDVVERYDIDGVHFDDYFYPYPSYAGGDDFPDSVSWQRALDAGVTLSRNDWRRDNVNRLMRTLSERISEVKPHVKFGISPFGIWRPGYPENTTGFDAYEQLYADAKLWLKEGWVDYFTPQIYYRIDQDPQPFPVMLQWWQEQNRFERHMWPGLFTSRILTPEALWPQEEITGQIYTSRGFAGVSGTIHFSMRTFMENPDKFNSKLAAGTYAIPSLIPPSPWMSEKIPLTPRAEVREYGDYWSLYLEPLHEDEKIRWYVLRTHTNQTREAEIIPADRIETRFYGGSAMVRPDTLYISAVSRTGIESSLKKIRFKEIKKPEIKEESSLADVARKEWALNEPGGYDANAIRRNVIENDTLRFRDLTVIASNYLTATTLPRELLKGDVSREEDGREQTTVSATLTLYRNGVTETLTLQKGETVNWYGYHLGLLDLNMAGSLAQLEIATTGSLPVNRYSARGAGSASERLRVPHRIQKITLHHTGSAEPLSADRDPKEVLRALYKWGVEERNWWDVPYHYLIDLEGTVYEGRDAAYAGETNTEYDPRGHLLISVMGNYNLQEPTRAQVEAISRLMAEAIRKYDLDTEHIYGHYDWADTNCPGKYLTPLLEDSTIEQMVREKLNREE